ncbi:hypothetical protein J2T19_001773 [Paenibacillus tundrae]|uniref:Uncharacterized protein n=1 Tax=Paenibacillus tundrae TaxID=528187 RepID=A0ABT9WAN8_9BACL|nr:hypothetical protein [Paenibacillus tundrae]
MLCNMDLDHLLPSRKYRDAQIVFPCLHSSVPGRDSKELATASHQPAALCAPHPCTAPVHYIYLILDKMKSKKPATSCIYARDDRLFTFAVPLLLTSPIHSRNSCMPKHTIDYPKPSEAPSVIANHLPAFDPAIQDNGPFTEATRNHVLSTLIGLRLL